VRHILQTDPSGAFVAERDGRPVGVAQAMRREGVWCLSLLVVQPGRQSAGSGRALMRRALDYAQPSDSGLIVSSNDARAIRLYTMSGFAPRATFESVGKLDRRSLQRPHAEVREGDAADLEALASISREIRGAAHTHELELVLSEGAHLLRLGDRGFAVIFPGYGLWLLAARDDEAACALLWDALAIADDGDRPAVRWITSEQQWALDVVLRAGMGLTAYGALCVRGAPGPLRRYIPSGPFA
jgi:hypothetical protein